MKNQTAQRVVEGEGERESSERQRDEMREHKKDGGEN